MGYAIAAIALYFILCGVYCCSKAAELAKQDARDLRDEPDEQYDERQL